MGKSFRNTASFGKRIEYYIIGLMLKEGLDVYVPLVDDDAIDAVVKRPDGSFVLAQIKARSNDNKIGNAALFAGLTHEIRENYWFIFFSERMNMLWIMNSDEFINESILLKSGINVGKRTIKFNLHRKDKATNSVIETCNPKFEKYIAKDFHRLLE